MPSNAIFLSIRPEYAKKIIEGNKTVELRRIRPKYITKGALVLIYVSSPIKSLMGAFRVDRVVREPLQDLWNIVCGRADISRSEFDAYFEGVSTGVGIFFDALWVFHNPIVLQDLREFMDFRPPQSFRYATANELSLPQFEELVEDINPVLHDYFLQKGRGSSKMADKFSKVAP